MSDSADPFDAVSDARRAYRQIDAELPKLRAVHGDLTSLHETLARNKPDGAAVDVVLDSLGRLGGENDDRRNALAFLAEAVLPEDRTVAEAFRHGRAVTTDADAVASALDDYVTGGPWSALRAAVTDVLRPDQGPMAIDTTTLDQLGVLFGLTVEAGMAARRRHSEACSAALDDAYEGIDGVLPEMGEQPITLFPVRLETRFVDDDRGTSGPRSQLLIRVYPDQVHTDAHEPELTDDEVVWGQNFWGTLWYARHPDTDVVPSDPTGQYLQDRLPNQRLREVVGGIDPAAFSDRHAHRYDELKERAWGQLLDRFGRERAAYVVHTLEPTDETLANDLLTRPPSIDEYLPATDGGRDVDESDTPDISARDWTVDSAGAGESISGPGDTQVDLSDAVVGEQGSEYDLDEIERQLTESAGPGIFDSVPDLPSKVPALSFPTVPRKPESWTQQPRARLLPDRWVAVGEWTDPHGETHRTAVAGSPVEEPLPVGPSAESVAGAELDNETSDSPAPAGTEWMVGFDEAEAVGMGLRIRLGGLAGFSPANGFDRLTVLGVKASLDEQSTPEALRDLLDAHHYTDGLSFLDQGTPTNNHDGGSGYSKKQPPAESAAVECVPPLVEDGDRTDGDLLARALAIGSDEDHVFANVENAGGTQQRDARHVNSALWPATLGYFFQDLLIDNRFTDNESLWESGGGRVPDSQRRDALTEPMLWLDAYRRHFVRYVRGRGPFPTLRVGRQPYGILPTKAIETERDVTLVDQDLIEGFEHGALTVEDLPARGTSVDEMVHGGVAPQTLLDSGANPDQLVEAGADPKQLVAGGVAPETVLDASGVAPDALTQDGIGILATSRVTKPRLRSAGVPVDELQSQHVTVGSLARGEVTDEQLDNAGVTTDAIADVLLPRQARSLGITPKSLETAGVSPGELLRGELSAAQVEQLGLSTRAVADAVLPRSVREMGVTPKTFDDAGIGPQDLFNGTVSPDELQRAGVTTETLAAALLPEELEQAGITPERIGRSISVADLFNGDIGAEEAAALGLDTETLADALLPQSFHDAGITPSTLEDAGITPDAVLNGRVTPEDVVDAGLTPEALAEAGVLPEALADIGEVFGDLLDAGLEPMELLERGLTPASLVDAGVDPHLLVEAGLAPKHLVDAGVDAVTLAAKGSIPIGDLLDAGASPAELARVGATVADLAGGDVPAEELVRAGFTAIDVLGAGADALGVASAGARPTQLREAGVDAGTLRDAEKAAGSMRRAGYTASELVDAGYSAGELLNGGFSPEALTAAGVSPSDASGGGRPVSELLGSGFAPSELRARGYAPDQLLDAGVETETLVGAGYTAGELLDAGLSVERLATAGVDIESLRAAGAETEALAAAGVGPGQLRDIGASATALLDHGFDPQALLDAGFESAELSVAGVDVDSLTADVVTGEADAGDVADSVVSGLGYAATVLEDPEQAERDRYSFSFDPAVPTHARQPDRPPWAEDEEESPAGQTDGGVTAGVPVVRPLSIDDRLPGRLERRVRGFGSAWADAADGLPFAGDTDEDALLNALKREGLSADIRQQTMVYSGESSTDSLGVAVGQHFHGDQREAVSAVLEAADATDLDPRIASFYPTDATIAETRTIRERSESTYLQHFYDRHHRQQTRIVEPHDVVDADIGQFVDVLLGSTVSEVRSLSDKIYTSRLSIDPGLLDIDDSTWGSLGFAESRNRIVSGIENAATPAQLAQQLAGGQTGDGASKVRQLGSNQAEFGDSGVLRSLLRLLLQYGTLQAYISARRRLGMAYDDVPDGWPEPAYYEGQQSPIETLTDEAPTALSAHPNVGSMATAENDVYTYADALEAAAANYDSSTSIDPRLSEFTDSLRYLSGVDPAKLATLTRETLDLASHRLDAWWTSLATKRLFELREAQGTYDSEAGFDHEAWSGGTSEVPRATIDPALLSSIDVDSSPNVDVGDAPDDATSQPTGVGAQFDPATIADTDIAFDDGPDRRSEPDGGIEQDGVEQRNIEQGDTRQGDVEKEGIDDSEGPDGTATAGGGMRSLSELRDAGALAERTEIEDPSTLQDRTQADPGLYVGGYGFVEDLSADVEGRDAPEYVHAPSEQHAATAALLRGGAEAHDADEGDNAMAVDLSAERVRDGLRLIRGVRRGQSLGELLGYRFERRLHEETVLGDENLMQYADTFRAACPATVGSLERPDENRTEEKSDRADDMAARDVVDGYKLLKQWEQYPFGRGSELPDMGSHDYSVLGDIVGELETAIDAAGDLLTAESVHQLGQGNFERAGGSVGALARGEPLPDPAVAKTPRSETGLTHRQTLLLGETTAQATATPRTAAEPALAAWVETLLPAHDDVECLATYRWTETTTDPATGDEQEAQHSESTSVALSALGLGPLDVLLLFGADSEAARSELQQRLVYRLLRTRPSDPPVPADATVELTLGETATEGATSMADLLEVTRSLRELVQTARPVDAEDLAHPTDQQGEGYDDTTATTIENRADEAQDRLFEVASDIDERIAVLDADHTAGDGLDGVPAPSGVSADGGAPSDGSWDTLGGGVTVPGLNSPALDAAFNFSGPTLTEQVTAVAEAVDAVDEDVPFAEAESVGTAIDAGAVRSELSALCSTLPAGVADPETVTADVTVYADSDQMIAGRLGSPVDVPAPGADGEGGPGGSDGDDTGDDGGEAPSDNQNASGDGDATGAQSGGGSFQYGTVGWMPSGAQFDASVGVESVATTVDPATDTETVDTVTVADLDLPDSVLAPVGGGGASTGGASDGDQGDDGNHGDDDQGDGSDDAPAVDWSATAATIKLWGTDALSWFEREQQVTPDEDGQFSVTVDVSDVEPGTPFRVVALVDGDVVYSATGRVLGDDETTTQDVLDADCPNLRRLLWLRDRQPLYGVEEGPSATLDAALSAVDWAAVAAERDRADPATTPVTTDDVGAVDDALALTDLDPETLAGHVDSMAGPVGRLGLDQVVDVTGTGGPDSVDYWYGPTASVTDVRARLSRTLENPALYVDGAAPWLLSYHHDAAAVLHEMDDGATAAAYLDAFLAQPAWSLRYLGRELDAPSTLVADLTAWLYAPEELTDAGALATALSNLADVLSDLPALAVLFEGLQTGEAATTLSAFESHLTDLAAAIGTTSPSLAGPATADATFDSTLSTAATEMAAAADTEATTLAPVVGSGVDRAFRRMVLEALREPMTVAASYGVFGGTPTRPDGGRPADERVLLEQARALLERLRTRLQDAAALDPRLASGLSSRPVPQRVEDGTDRLETLFGDGFTVLPPFTASNPDELTATFTDSGLVPDDAGMAAETWLQRAGAVRTNVAQFREARSYAEALSGTLTPSLTVGQVPYEPGDTWVGTDGVEPAGGKLSLVAQFGPGATPGTVDTRMTGLFVDEWTEGVPSDSETTGVALQYDDPGNRAPQSILVATPPDDGDWTLDNLLATVDETAEYTRRRAVDMGDLDDVTRLLPALNFPQQTDATPSTATVDFGMVEWYDERLVEALVPVDRVIDFGGWTTDE